MASVSQSGFGGGDANSHPDPKVTNTPPDNLHDTPPDEAMESQPCNEDQDSVSEHVSRDENDQATILAPVPPPAVEEGSGSDFSDNPVESVEDELKGKLGAETPAGPNKEPQDQHTGNGFGDALFENPGEPIPIPAQTPQSEIALGGEEAIRDIQDATDGTQERPATWNEQDKEDAGQPETCPETVSASPEQGDESRGQPPTTKSHNGKAGSLVKGPDSPMGKENDDQDKEVDKTQGPSLSELNTTELPPAHEEIPESRDQDEHDSYKNSRSRPPSTGSGHTTSAPWESPPYTHQAPIFFMPDTEDAGFAPFWSSDGSPPQGETLADIYADDQIRRTERQIGPLSNAMRDRIRAHFAERAQGNHAPSETSEPDSEQTAPLLLGSDAEPSSSAANPSSDGSSFAMRRGRRTSQVANPAIAYRHDGQATDLSRRVDELSINFTSSEEERIKDQRILDDTVDEVTQLRQRQEETDKKLAAIADELKDLKKWQRAQRQQQQQPRSPPQAGRPSFAAVAAAGVVLVWLVAEAMLHSKRLSEGYGPFVNGGFNGLGSVVVFGTWGRFLGFSVAMVFLGVLSVMGAAGE